MKKIGFLLLSAFLTIPVFGYEFQTSPLQVVGPLAAQQQRMDDNGAVCGLLVVETDIQNIEFKLSTLGGCGVEKTSKGYNVYLAEGTDNISLTAPGFKSLSWKFSMPGNKILPQQYQARVERDGRLKRIVPTEKAAALRGEVLESIRSLESMMAEGIGKEEFDICIRVLRRMSENLSEDEKNPRKN